MRQDIHPAYNEITVTCGCGNSFTTRSTKDKISVEICSNCHPFYTGRQKFVDTAGRVERFQRRWQSDAAKKAREAAATPAKKTVEEKIQAVRRASQTLADQLPGGSKKEEKKSVPAAAPKTEVPKVEKPAAKPVVPKPPEAPKAEKPPAAPPKPEAPAQNT